MHPGLQLDLKLFIGEIKISMPPLLDYKNLLERQAIVAGKESMKTTKINCA